MLPKSGITRFKAITLKAVSLNMLEAKWNHLGFENMSKGGELGN
jgi:hypothetical protein